MKSFYVWMVEKYFNKDSRRGDLARDASTDISFPRNGNYVNMLNYLQYDKGACAACINVFKGMWKSYEKRILSIKTVYTVSANSNCKNRYYQDEDYTLCGKCDKAPFCEAAIYCFACGCVRGVFYYRRFDVFTCAECLYKQEEK